ncbi:hypothetical protein [Chromobacterium sp. CV08]|uniref:hypothetical protein n=1 Tax=Chromobacterium sp. CV08 TaxID=3133274 RepID=UPI003DA876BD
MKLIKLIAPLVAVGLALASPLSRAEPEDQPLPGDFQPAPAAKPLHQPHAASKSVQSKRHAKTGHKQAKSAHGKHKASKARAHAAKHAHVKKHGKQTHAHAGKKPHKPAKAHKGKHHKKPVKKHRRHHHKKR